MNKENRTETYRCRVCKVELSGWCWIAPEDFYCARHTSTDIKVQQERLTGGRSVHIEKETSK